MAKDKQSLTKVLLSRWETMKNERANWDGIWKEIAEYVMPRKDTNLPGQTKNEALFDSTAIQANQTLANGMLSYVTPSDGQWFTYGAPLGKPKSDKADAWLQKATETTKSYLSATNFYTEIHESYFDNSGFGTSVLLALEGKTTPIYFISLNIGTYCIAEDDEGNVDTLYREFEITARNAALKWGEANLSDKMKKELIKWREKGGTETKYKILHAIYPRTDAERESGKVDGPNKPYASVYMSMTCKHVLSDGGYDEKPFFVSRYLKWGSGVWGFSPSFVALPEARQLNFLVQMLDSLAEIKAYPRFLVPYSLEGEINIGAGGRTFFDPNKPNEKPSEWMTQGDYNVGLDRENRKQEAINRAFHVDLFQMFSQIDKQMTAREVAERSSEKLVQFTPAFSRKTTELLTPMLQRIFGMLFRAGLFGPPEDVPPELIETDPDGSKFVPVPEIAYNSRAAIAIKAHHNLAFARTMETVMPLAQLRPDVLDNFDLDTITRDSARNDGLPADWMIPLEKVEEARAARAEAQAKQQELEQAALMAKAAGDAGKVTPDSLIGQQLQAA